MATAKKPAPKRASASTTRTPKKTTKSASKPKRKTTPKRTKAELPLSEQPVEQLWKKYGESRDEGIRNFFMEKYYSLVRYHAERVHARLPDEVNVEDLVQAGVFGLADAINAFDLDRQVKFETYCAPRIRGAILDELRLMDWVPRLVRHRSSKVEQARQRLEMDMGRPATHEELAEMLGVDEEEYEKIRRDSSAVGTFSLTRKAYPSDGDRDVREIDVIRDDSQMNPVRNMERRDLQDLITKGLSRAERLIVILYYFEGMTMKEIGATLDLSESRVSQMHSSILARVKAQVQHRVRELEPSA
ncbi:MAG TPA: FliA/WhiG family RNA polymerase sigma factor [Phycisphaerales bacterium]|nr:FliA/WhiG family RNA polymerase sigma factor [Phycisphaerales bacterium]